MCKQTPASLRTLWISTLSAVTCVFVQGTRKAEFITAICGLDSSEQTEESWVPCDPLAFAAALDASIVTAADDVRCTVEVTDAESRGQTRFDAPDTASKHSEQHSNSGLVHRVKKVNLDRFAELLDASTE